MLSDGVAHQHIPHRHRRRVDQIGFFRAADAETGEFDHVYRDDSGHFRGFAAGQNAVAGLQIVRHAGNQAGDFRLIERGDSDVIEKQQRIPAGCQDVVDAHRHQIHARRFQQIMLQQEFQLGSDAVATGHDHRLLIATQIVTRRKQPERTPQFAGLLGSAHVQCRYRPPERPPCACPLLPVGKLICPP